MTILSRVKKQFAQKSESSKALIISEKRYHDFVTSSRDWIWETDKEGNTSYSNQAVQDILGFTAAELIGHSCTEHMHEDDQEEIRKMIPQCIASKTGWHNELVRWKSKQGDIRYLESSSVVIFDEKGEFAGFRGVDRDVTERIQAEKAYREGVKTLNNAFDATPDGVSITRLSDGTFIYANPALSRMSKYSLDEIIGKTIIELNFYKDPNARNELIQILLSGQQVADFQTEFKNKNGEIIPGSISCSLVELNGDQCIITIIRDISERKAAEEELRKLSTAIEQCHDAIFITDTDGIIEYANFALTELTGYSREELVGAKPNIWKSNKTDSKIYDDLWQTIISGEVWTGEILNRKKNGEFYWSLENISPILNVRGKITHYLGSQKDVTDIRTLNKQLILHAKYDSLTGLINRREFERRLEHIVTNPNKKPDVEHALFFMDLDQFKVVNDTCGHTAGDELLRQLSKVLREKVQNKDTVARIGGDEFAILMENCTIEQAYIVANKLLDAVHNFHFQWEKQTFRIGVSIGLIPIKDSEYNTTELLKNADSACYIAKEQGRNRTHVYHLDDEELVRRNGEMSWVSKLYQALEENRFCLYAQSIIPIDKSNSSHKSSYEMLLRIIDESGQIVTPAQFFPAAERYNLATQLDKWVIRHIFETLSQQPDFLSDVEFICINLSGFSLTDMGFLDYIINQILNYSNEIEPTKICFEITETAAITHLSNASNFISILKEMGCKFALDDFGSGLSSFGYLKNLPVDYLKIDGMFVKDIVDDQIDHAMVKSINEIGHVMKMKTIAEYVENDEIKGMLREIGVDYAQGYGINRPVALDELLKEHVRSSNNVIELKPNEISA
jgi:diguanylate cyclase (GGDEF)-like protein/PAS domain S-box-containing protein